jgi:hypothetical protein
LIGHEVHTVQSMGWAGMGNGKLLELAGREFDVFLAADQNLQHQQSLSDVRVGIVVLTARDNRIETLQPLLPEVLEAIADVRPGRVVHVGA